MSVITGMNQPARRPVNVIAYYDASEKVIEPYMADRLESLEQAEGRHGDDFQAHFGVARAGVAPWKKVVKGAGRLLGQAALSHRKTLQ